MMITKIQCGENDTFFKAIYWSKKPYIYKDNNCVVEGMIPEMLHLSEYYCGCLLSYQKFIDYVVEVNGMAAHIDLLHGNVSYGECLLENVTEEKALWLPFMQDIDHLEMWKLSEKRNITNRNLLVVNKLVVVALKSRISLNVKILRGVYNCRTLLLLVFMASLVFSMSLRFATQAQNKLTSTNFMRGLGTRLWFAVTTLSTVGYGDIVPKSSMTRFLTAFWMLFGMAMWAVVTAIIIDTVENEVPLHLNETRITVINNSLEAIVAKHNYGVNIVYAKSQPN